MFIYDDVDDMADYFNKLLLTECQKIIPQKTVVIKPQDKPWMTKQIKHKLLIRDKFHRRWKTSKSMYALEQYKLIRAEANMAMLEAKVAHHERIKERLCNPSVGNKEYWHLLKLIYGNKINNGIPSIIDNDNIIATSIDKAILFNELFLQKSTLPTNLPALPVDIPCTSSLSTFEISEEDVSQDSFTCPHYSSLRYVVSMVPTSVGSWAAYAAGLL